MANNLREQIEGQGKNNNFLNSYLMKPNGEVINIEYYDIADKAMDIVNSMISNNENLKLEFEQFKIGYNHFDPFLDFLIIHLGFVFVNPFCTEEGYLYGKSGELHYVLNPFDEKHKKDMIYPKSDDKSLGIDMFSVDKLCDCIIDNYGRVYNINRDNGDFHGMYYEIVLMNKMIENKRLYEDYKTCTNEYDELYYVINAYFRDRLGYVQVVKYPDDTGHVLCNSELKSGYIDGVIKGIKEMYPNMNVEYSHIPLEIVDECKDIQSEVSDIYASRRI
ncbi:MAG: hypothetical protein J6G98_05080 [Bacilli bacterium]|nr:hypothetical protein [Bacilli bacterium]